VVVASLRSSQTCLTPTFLEVVTTRLEICEDRSVTTRMMFDSGSQLPLVTKRLVLKHNLPVFILDHEVRIMGISDHP
jgi:hypothetical protein